MKTDGARLEANFNGLTLGIFAGGLRFTHYRGTNLLRVEAIAKTEQNLVAYNLSEIRLAEGRTFDALDQLNNLYAGGGLRPKVLIGDVDTYQKWPHDDLFPGFTVNYLQLDRVPGPDESWAPVLQALRDGRFFVTTGEIHIRNYAVHGTGARRTIEADVDWTFPLEFVEVVWGDGKSVGREVIRATDLPAMGTKHFSIPFEAAGRKWARFAVWDSAVNGAFVQPVWLQ